MGMNKPIAAVIGGGTLFHVRPHLALAAPAYGETARRLASLLEQRAPGYRTVLHLTRMAGGAELDTNQDIAELVAKLVADPAVKMLFLPAALCDFEAAVLTESGTPTASGKDQPRLRTAAGAAEVRMWPADKVIGQVRRHRKDIFLIGFKTTAGATADEQFEAGLTLLKTASCNLVLANDLQTGMNMIVTPEQARYAVTHDRQAVLTELVDIAIARAGLHFTRTHIVPGQLLPWRAARIPYTFRRVVEHCIARGAYRPFRGVTVGHFAFAERSGAMHLWSSRRKQDFNSESGRDLVGVSISSEGQLIAGGAKPSAGTRSQYEVLRHFPDFDCIIHFHCPARPGSPIPRRSQRELECGSHECGENTWRGMTRLAGGAIAAVMLDHHGPNILFRSTGDPRAVIAFIEEHFDLDRATSEDQGTSAGGPAARAGLIRPSLSNDRLQV